MLETLDCGPADKRCTSQGRAKCRYEFLLQFHVWSHQIQKRYFRIVCHFDSFL